MFSLFFNFNLVPVTITVKSDVSTTVKNNCSIAIISCFIKIFCFYLTRVKINHVIDEQSNFLLNRSFVVDNHIVLR